MTSYQADQCFNQRFTSMFKIMNVLLKFISITIVEEVEVGFEHISQRCQQYCSHGVSSCDMKGL